MRARCPVCGTVFRVTTEQLRLKAGKVRCGHCQAVFNAFEEVVPEPSGGEGVTVFSVRDHIEFSPESLLESAGDVPLAEKPETLFEGEGASMPTADDTSLAARLIAEKSANISASVALSPEVELAVLEVSAELPPKIPVEAEAPSEAYKELPIKPVETPEESRQAAREAGLIAARELNDTPGYNRWATGTLAGLDGFEAAAPHRAVWPFVIVSLLLILILSGQLLFHFRTEFVQRFPDSAGLYMLAAVDVTLPRNSELVAIETSDLQSDATRGLLVLRATLRNRAGHAQAWPALELTLTDTNDTVVSRRVLTSADYLPPVIDAASFEANAEVAIKLWIEAKEIGAAGYRLYIFYP